MPLLLSLSLSLLFVLRRDKKTIEGTENWRL
jgi:hypothetical protein